MHINYSNCCLNEYTVDVLENKVDFKKKIALNPLLYQYFNCMNVMVEECCCKMDT